MFQKESYFTYVTLSLWLFFMSLFCSSQEDRLTSLPHSMHADKEAKPASVTITKVFDFAGEEVRYVSWYTCTWLLLEKAVPHLSIWSRRLNSRRHFPGTTSSPHSALILTWKSPEYVLWFRQGQQTGISRLQRSQELPEEPEQHDKGAGWQSTQPTNTAWSQVRILWKHLSAFAL